MEAIVNFFVFCLDGSRTAVVFCHLLVSLVSYDCTKIVFFLLLVTLDVCFSCVLELSIVASALSLKFCAQDVVRKGDIKSHPTVGVWFLTIGLKYVPITCVPLLSCK